MLSMQPCRVNKGKSVSLPLAYSGMMEGSNSGSEWSTKNGRQRDHTEQLGSSVNYGKDCHAVAQDSSGRRCHTEHLGSRWESWTR